MCLIKYRTNFTLGIVLNLNHVNMNQTVLCRNIKTLLSQKQMDCKFQKIKFLMLYFSALLTLNRAAIKIFVAVRLEVIYDFLGDQ
jgi:hypothetical protein